MTTSPDETLDRAARIYQGPPNDLAHFQRIPNLTVEDWKQ